jgi:hypothetical protein
VKTPNGSWPGVLGFIGANYSCQHGISPNTASVTIAIQNLDVLSKEADLVLGDGDIAVTLRGARLAGWSMADSAGKRVILRIQDGRWRWKHGTISGVYNERDDQGRSKKERRKDPYELMQLCWEAMPKGPQNILITGLSYPPDPDSWPAVNWRNANPAQALSELAGRFGLRVIYQPNVDGVLVAPPGVGATVDYVNWTTKSGGVDLPSPPDILTAVSEQNYVTMALPLEAVALDLDGVVRLLDDVSYKPDAGWNTVGPPFKGIIRRPLRELAIGGEGDPPQGFNAPDATDEDAQRLCNETVAKWYRVRLVQANAPQIQLHLDTPGFPDLVSLDQILLSQGIMDHTAGPDNTVCIFPPKVYGSYSTGTTKGQVTIANQEIAVPFTVDAERRLVRFSRPVYRLAYEGTGDLPEIGYALSPNAVIPGSGITAAGAGGNWGPAHPVLLISVRLRVKDTGEIWPAFRSQRLGNGTLERVIHLPDAVFNYHVRYDVTTWTIDSVATNENAFFAECDYHLAGAALEYQTGPAQDASFPGLLPIDPDGLIQQVSWSVGGGSPVMTQVSSNCEHTPHLPPYRQRMKMREMDDLLNKKITEKDLRLEPVAANPRAKA